MTNRKQLIKEIVHIIKQVDNVSVLKDMLNLVNGVYKHYIAGNW